MIRTQIQLTADQARVLKDLAHQEQASIAELTRRALDYWLQSLHLEPDAERTRRALAAASRSHPDQPAISEQSGEYAVEAYRTETQRMVIEAPVALPPRPPAHPYGAIMPPPLEPGDRLTAREFERRYRAMPHLKKAELIEGVVYMPSPVHVSHAVAHSQISTWLGVYSAATPGVQLADNATLRLDPDNVVQPDALLRLEPEHGGRSRISRDDYYEGAPELIVEIATSSAAYDLFEKRRVYRRNGVQEYVVWQVADARLDWWRLEEGEFVPLSPDADGVIASQVFPGLWLDVSAMLTGQLAAALAKLRQGLAAPEHASFAEAHLSAVGGRPMRKA